MQNHLSPAAPAPEPCALCECEPGTIDAIDDTRPVRVCAACLAYFADGEEDAA